MGTFNLRTDFNAFARSTMQAHFFRFFFGEVKGRPVLVDQQYAQLVNFRFNWKVSIIGFHLSTRCQLTFLVPTLAKVWAMMTLELSIVTVFVAIWHNDGHIQVCIMSLLIGDQSKRRFALGFTFSFFYRNEWGVWEISQQFDCTLFGQLNNSNFDDTYENLVESLRIGSPRRRLRLPS